MNYTDAFVGQELSGLARKALPAVVATYVAGELAGRFFFNKVVPALRYAFTTN